MGDADVLNAVMNATEGLLCKLQVAQQTQPNFIAAQGRRKRVNSPAKC